MPLKPSYLLLAGAGAIVIVSGIKGWDIGHTFRDVIAGKDPGKNPQLASQISGTPAGAVDLSGLGIGAPASSNSAIAQDALQYGGAGYVWGGAPAKGVGNWDCSSFCNWVIGHDLGLAIPGFAAGSYTGSSHGPPTGAWLLWPGVVNVARQNIQAGDLCVWQTHMGIAINNSQMISALNSATGTQVTTIEGGAPSGELFFGKRLAVMQAATGTIATARRH